MRITLSSRELTASRERRTIAGRIVTFGEAGSTSAGPTIFEAGSISYGDDVRLVLEHDTTKPLGRATKILETKDGIDASFRIAATRLGDDVLVEAAEQLRDGFSVGVDVVQHRVEDGTLIVELADLDHIGLVTRPALDSARVDRVAASEPSPEGSTTEGNTMPDTEVDVVVDEPVEVVDVVEASRPAPVVRTSPRVKPFGSAAEYVLAAHAAFTGDRDQLTRITAAAGTLTDQKLAGNPALVPTKLLEPIIDVETANRPIIDSSRHMPMPAAGSSFDRPIITQHTLVGVQDAELEQLQSRSMTFDKISVDKVTYGGALRISFQDRDWTDPAILSIVIADMVKQYARSTEAAAAGELIAGATGTGTLAANATSDAVIKAIYDAAVAVNVATGDMPNVVYAAPDTWARLGSLVDAQKRPIFPTLAPVNAPGGTMDATAMAGNPLGLRLVVSRDLAAGTFIVGSSSWFETYELVGGQLSVVDPNVLGFTIAYYGYFAAKVIVGGAFTKLAASGA
jgi:HK97 family phage prohead protease